MNICEHLTATAKLIPAKQALIFEGASYSYAQLSEMSLRAAAQLAELGVCTGDRVAIMLPNVPGFVAWYYGALRLGALPASLSSRLAGPEAEYMLADCGARALVAQQDALEVISASVPRCVVDILQVDDQGRPVGGESRFEGIGESKPWVQADPDAAAVILYTSGTTGFNKGATLSHGNVRSNVASFNFLCGMKAADRILATVPLFHCFGQNAVLNSGLNAGATLVLQRGFDLNETKTLIAEQRITQLYGVPTMFQMLLEYCQPADLESVTYCFSAAAKLPEQVSRQWQEKFGLPIHEGYGLTESSPFASYNHRLLHRVGSIGAPIDGAEMRVVDPETGAEREVGELGEIAIRGPNVMLGYWNQPEETGRVIRNGWLHSGDIGRVDEHGYFYLVDRVKDMISVGGLKVYPAEVERVLTEHPGLSQAAVVGFPAKVLGEQVTAFVVTEAQDEGSIKHLTAQLQAWCRQRLADYKRPSRFVFVEELPRNATGKILKKQLRACELPAHPSAERIEAGAGVTPSERSGDDACVEGRSSELMAALTAAYPATRKDVAQRYLQDLVQSLSPSGHRPQPEDRFLDADLDSVLIVEMTNRLEADLGLPDEIQATLIFDYPRVNDLAEELVSMLVSQGAVNPVRMRSNRSSPAKEQSEANGAGDSRPTVESTLRQEIQSMSDQEAHEQLMRELEGQ